MSSILRAAEWRDLPRVQELLRERPERIEERSAIVGSSALLLAAEYGHLETVKWLLREGGSHIGEADNYGNTALIVAARYSSLETVAWLLREGGSHIGETNTAGNAALILADAFDKLEMVGLLLEHGADIADTGHNGATVWTILMNKLVADDMTSSFDSMTLATITALLRVMVLRGAPPAELTARLSLEHEEVEEGARLRAQLPAYLAQQRALLDAHCPLITPLQDLVHGYEMPTATDELWATGLGAASAPP
jgi:hypothetical protein